MFLDLVPMLMCDDVQASIEFYTEVLGLEVVDRMDDVGRSGWASLRKDRAQLMLASPTYIPPGRQVDGRFPQSLYYFHVDDLDELHARAQERGAGPTDIEQRFYDQREFEVVDPDGHVLVFGEHSPAKDRKSTTL